MIRVMLLLFISAMPFNLARIFLYRFLLGYHISYKSIIGMFNFIDCKMSCDIAEQAHIGFFNLISVNHLKMAASSIIFAKNRIEKLNQCELKINANIYRKNTLMGLRPQDPCSSFCNFLLGENSLLTGGHYLDFTDSIKIGNNVVCGGFGTQFWSHGFDLSRVRVQGAIELGDDIYVGAGVKILGGVSIASKVIVGAGTVVSKDIKESGFYVSQTLERKSELPDYSALAECHDIYKVYRKK